MIIGQRQTLRDAINKAAASDGVVDLNGTTVWINDRIDLVEGVQIRNGVIKFSGPAHLVLLAKSPSLRDLIVDSAGYSSVDPIIEFVDTDGARISNVQILGNNPRKAVVCKTRAINTDIDGLSIIGQIGWGVLFNDAIREQKNPAYRVFDGKDYAGEPLGRRLSIRNYTFGMSELVRPGDGIEINCPENGFSDIVLENITINKTLMTAANGIGMGFANCTKVRINNARVYNAALSGIHFEKGSDHIVNGFYVEGGGRGISIGHTADTTFQSGECVNNTQWVTAYNTTTERGPGDNLTIEDTIFRGCTSDGFLISNATRYKLRRLTFSGYKGGEMGSFIKLYRQDTLGLRSGVDESQLENLTFIRNAGDTAPDSLISLENSPNNVIKHVNTEGGMDRVVKIDGNYVRV